MAYTPTEWVCGDTITAERLNKLENGLAECCGGGGAEPLIVNVNNDVPASLDHSWQDICDAFPNVYIKKISGSSFGDEVSMHSVCELDIIPRTEDTTVYLVAINGLDEIVMYETNSADGYPILPM